MVSLDLPLLDQVELNKNVADIKIRTFGFLYHLFHANDMKFKYRLLLILNHFYVKC